MTTANERLERWRAEAHHGSSAKQVVMQDMLAEIYRLRAALERISDETATTRVSDFAKETLHK